MEPAHKEVGRLIRTARDKFPIGGEAGDQESDVLEDAVEEKRRKKKYYDNRERLLDNLEIRVRSRHHTNTKVPLLDLHNPAESPSSSI